LKLLREAFEISQLKSSHEFGGISCFVFEQSMSRWLDSEFEDFSQLPKFQEHLDKCHSCQSTLEAFRKGDKELYRSKQRYPVMSQREFDETKRRAQQQWRKARVKAAVFTFLIVGFLALIFYFLFQSHGPTPNVFEMRG